MKNIFYRLIAAFILKIFLLHKQKKQTLQEVADQMAIGKVDLGTTK